MSPTLRDATPESPAPVRAAARGIESWVERLGAVWVEGQLTQVSRRQGSATVFLTLRDRLADVSIALTCPRGVIDSLAAPPVEGAHVVVHAKPSYYVVRGTMSLAVREIRLLGEGELLARLERRRRLLAAEGLFEPRLKRPLPFLPSRVGLVTGEGSAAERDVRENATRRWPGVAFRIRYAATQGAHAARELIEAIGALDRDPEVDVIVVARGGGSIEDLLPFSDEALIRAVHQARTPIVSAVGHEQDNPLLDLVADVRASTPTDAAKRIVPDVAAEAQLVLQLRERGRRALVRMLDGELARLADVRSRPVLADPRTGLGVRLDEVTVLRDRGRRALGHAVDRDGTDLAHQLARVRSLSPLATLRRGYAVVAGPEGRLLSSVAGLGEGAQLVVRVADGRIEATSTAVEALPLPGLPTGEHDDRADDGTKVGADEQPHDATDDVTAETAGGTSGRARVTRDEIP